MQAPILLQACQGIVIVRVRLNPSTTNVSHHIETSQLTVKVDTKVNFEHLNHIISKASRKVNALSRVVRYMNLSKKKKLMNSFFNSQFSYYPLVLMFHSLIMNNKILHERCMRLIYGGKTSSLEELLDQDKSISIHTRNLQMLTTEMFKVYRGMSPPFFIELFCRLDISYNLRSNSNFALPNVKSVFHGSEIITYLGPKIRDIVPLQLKELTSLNAFKKGIKNGNQKIVLAGYVNSTY